MAATDALLTAALQADPARPLLTFYDDATGERTELSATTLAGWVAKTAGLAQDELAIESGDRVAVLLPAHWQTAAVLLGCWAAGAVIDTDPTGAAAVFCDEPRLHWLRSQARSARTSGSGQVVALPLLPLGRPFPTPPAGALDYAAIVPGQPDVFMPYAPVPDDAPAVPGLTGAELVAAVRKSAADQGISATDRVLITRPWNGFADWRDCLLAPLAAGASIVLCANADNSPLARRIESERATMVITREGRPERRPLE
jgi:uncharacterized protein (TIGR03089 family)